MTTLAVGRAEWLAQIEESPDIEFQKRQRDQVRAVTEGDNPFYVWESLSMEEKILYGSIENHPMGLELCIDRWFKKSKTKELPQKCGGSPIWYMHENAIKFLVTREPKWLTGFIMLDLRFTESHSTRLL